MQNSGSTSKIFFPVAMPPPPPPPPPVPPPKFNPSTQDCKCKHSSSYKKAKQPRKTPKEEITSAVSHITYNFYVTTPSNLISLYRPVSPVLQEGRCCGIVALSMASQLIRNVDVEDILSLAKSLNFTKRGEMFSAYNLATLAESLLDCHALVVDNLNARREELLNHVCDGWPLLIPYDADRNHYPCLNSGMTAHWAVITGLGLSIVDSTNLYGVKICERVWEYPELSIFIVEEAESIKHLMKYSERIFLYARQGKSRHLAAWELNELLESNTNMYEVTKRYSHDDLVLPSSGDSLCELRDKAILLKKKN